jgi:four helix bundle protein
MVVRKYEDFVAFQLAERFKSEVFRIVKTSPEAMRDLRFKSQLFGAASGPGKHIAEGFLRRSPRAFALFLDYALGSVAEAQRRLGDGVELDYYENAICQPAFRLGWRCFKATARLKQTQIKYAEKLEEEKRRRGENRST